MNSGWNIILYFFVVIAFSTIYCVEYEPLIKDITSASRFFNFQEVKFDSTMEYFVVKATGVQEDVSIAYPQQSEFTPFMVGILNKVQNLRHYVTDCDVEPVPRIYRSKDLQIYNKLGFYVYTKSMEWIYNSTNLVPKPSTVIVLIEYKFDEHLKRISVLRYNIVGGKFLKPEPSLDIIERYGKNEAIFGYDIDSLYSQVGFPFVKVPLAPADDFLFDSWKSTSRQNILTALMLNDLQSQWQDLEIFIRKVTQIIDSVAIMVGISGSWLKLPIKNNLAPQYFWKAISLQVSYNDQQHNYGILFIMHNVPMPDPNSKSDKEKFCPEYDIANVGWKFLEDDQLKSPMYGCPLDKNIVRLLGEEIEGEFEDFNLNSMSLLKLDGEGNHIIEDVNVVEAMKKLEKSKTSAD